MTREELIELATRILTETFLTEKEYHKLVLLFMESTSYPEASDLFFSKENEDLTAEEIVDKALSYKPIQL